jgi:hypothetical protein
VSKSLKDAVAKKELLTSHQVYDILRAYIQEQVELSQREMLSKDNFEMPSWSEYQAYQLGTIKGLVKVLDFVPNLDPRK